MVNEKKSVVVTTEHRGVFFGYIVDDTSAPEYLILSDCRMCVSWAASVKGVLGLAATGPNDACRIGPSVPEAKLWRITGIFACTSEAAEAWEKAPWA